MGQTIVMAKKKKNQNQWVKQFLIENHVKDNPLSHDRSNP